MAFVNPIALPGRPTFAAPAAASNRPVMVAATHVVSRRVALHLAALGLAAAAGVRAVRAFDLEELKEDVEELKYDEEVTEVGPDSAEELITRTPKKKPENQAIVNQEKLEEKEEEQYKTVLAKEATEAAELKKSFEKARGFSK